MACIPLRYLEKACYKVHSEALRQVPEIYRNKGKAVAGMKTFHCESSVCIMMSGDASSCFAMNTGCGRPDGVARRVLDRTHCMSSSVCGRSALEADSAEQFLCIKGNQNSMGQRESYLLWGFIEL